MKLLDFLLTLALVPVALAQVTYSYVSVDYPDSSNTYLSGVNSAGDTVGAYLYCSGILCYPSFYSFYRSANGTFTPIVPNSSSFAAGISDSGVIVGGTGSYGMIIYHSQFHAVGSAQDPVALTGVSTNNLIVGTSAKYGAFEISGGKAPQLPSYNGQSISVTGINATGTIVGYAEDGETLTGLLLPPGGSYQVINYPGANPETQLTGINDFGTIVGTQFDDLSIPKGFTYANGVFSDVVFPGMGQLWATGINNNGVVVGYYVNPMYGTVHGFIATPVQ